MTDSDDARIDTASRTVEASPEILYQAFINPDHLVKWLPPEGMSGHIDSFEPQAGGAYKMILTYEANKIANGKTSENTDIIEGRFMELIPNEKIVQSVKFDSLNPAFQGEMKQTWFFESEGAETKVTIICEIVPEGIKKEDHDIGLKSTLENLSAFIKSEQSDI